MSLTFRLVIDSKFPKGESDREREEHTFKSQDIREQRRIFSKRES
jgi:hypothetical protein